LSEPEGTNGWIRREKEEARDKKKRLPTLKKAAQELEKRKNTSGAAYPALDRIKATYQEEYHWDDWTWLKTRQLVVMSPTQKGVADQFRRRRNCIKQDPQTPGAKWGKKMQSMVSECSGKGKEWVKKRREPISEGIPRELVQQKNGGTIMWKPNLSEKLQNRPEGAYRSPYDQRKTGGGGERKKLGPGGEKGKLESPVFED